MTTNNPPDPGTPDHSREEPTERIDVTGTDAGRPDSTGTDAGSTERTETLDTETFTNQPLDTQLLGAREDDATSTHDADATTWAPAPIPVQHNASGSMGDDSAADTDIRAHEPVIAPLPERPTGPHLPPLLLGVICLAVAGLALWQELADVSIDWGNVGPLGIVVVGAVLVVLGLIGLLGNRRRNT